MGNDVKSRLDNAQKTGSLQFSNLKLTKVPDDVRRITSLRVLDLSSNKLNLIEPWIGMFKLLKHLNLSKNKLSHLPSEIVALVKLETLLVAENQLTSLTIPSAAPMNLSRLSNLRTVDLSFNCISNFPVEFCFSTIPLDLLNLSNNSIAIIPSCVDSLQAIELNMNSNRVNTIAESLHRCPRLKVLRVDNNQLTMEGFPLAILESSNISLLSIEGNPLHVKALLELPAYQKYMDRYTATKRKAMP